MKGPDASTVIPLEGMVRLSIMGTDHKHNVTSSSTASAKRKNGVQNIVLCHFLCFTKQAKL